MCHQNERTTRTNALGAGEQTSRYDPQSSSQRPGSAGANTYATPAGRNTPDDREYQLLLEAAAARAQQAHLKAQALFNLTWTVWLSGRMSRAQRKEIIEALWHARRYLEQVQAIIAEMDTHLSQTAHQPEKKAKP